MFYKWNICISKWHTCVEWFPMQWKQSFSSGLLFQPLTLTWTGPMSGISSLLLLLFQSFWPSVVHKQKLFHVSLDVSVLHSGSDANPWLLSSRKTRNAHPLAHSQFSALCMNQKHIDVAMIQQSFQGHYIIANCLYWPLSRCSKLITFLNLWWYWV